jgi:aspartate aminotransferase-like enzyme
MIVNKLFIPGPVEVSSNVLASMTREMIGHRSPQFVKLYNSIQLDLKKLFYTKDPVYISTSSSFGVMEGCLRNLVSEKVLNCMNGAFSDKWHDVSLRCEKKSTPLIFEWGTPIDPEILHSALASDNYDAITLIHNETSTGTMSDLSSLMKVINKFPNVISIVDVVSSFSAMAIEKDNLGIDVMITGTQKALALPPGLCIFSVSQKALKKAATIKGRGYYFDLLEFQRNHEIGMTPSTPAISLFYALDCVLKEIFMSSLQTRYDRHVRLNKMVKDYFLFKGFTLFSSPGYGSITLNCFNNTRGIDLEKLSTILAEDHQMIIDVGYGKLKNKTFRISNMGDNAEENLYSLFKILDSILK